MAVNDIINLIGSVGFPIVACCVLFRQNDKLGTTLSELSATLQGINQRLDNIEDKVLNED